MTSKRGESDSRTVFVSLSVLILVVVVVGVVLTRTSFGDTFGTILPRFGNSSFTTDSNVTFRYSLNDGTIDYYDSNLNWVSSKKGAIFLVNGEQYTVSHLEEDFERFYYDSVREISSEVPLSFRAASNFYPDDPSIGLFYGLLLRTVRGDVDSQFGKTYVDIIFKSVDRSNQVPQGSAIVQLDDRFRFRAKTESDYRLISPEDYTEDHHTLINVAKQWRKSILSKPMPVSLSGVSYYCLKEFNQRGNVYLVVHLNTDVEPERVCNVT